MTTIMIDRAVIRVALAELLATELVGASKPVQAVYSYQVADFGGNSPVVYVTSEGSERRNPEHSVRSTSNVFLDVHIFVLYADPTATPAWTAQDSENRLDLIEKTVNQVVANNNGDDDTKLWMLLDFAGRSEVTSVVIGGKDYSWEVIPLRAELKGA